MKFTGTLSGLDEWFSFDECNWELTEVVVSKDRIAFDWIENDLHLGTTLYPKKGNSVAYFGDITIREDPTTKGYISAYRYDLKGGDILILAKWRLYDDKGMSIFELARE